MTSPHPGTVPAPGDAPVGYDAATHMYWVGDTCVPHVTEILRVAGLGPDYSRVPPATLALARDRGMYVDACCDALDADDLDWAAVDPECVGYVRSWEALKARAGFTVDATQVVVAHPSGFAGTLDVLGHHPQGRRRRRAIVDRKCTATIAVSYRVQLALYAMAVAPEDPQAIERMVAWLQPDGRAEWIVYDDPADFDCAREAVDVYQALARVAAWKAARDSEKKRRRR